LRRVARSACRIGACDRLECRYPGSSAINIHES
jgi:hypothetical protein